MGGVYTRTMESSAHIERQLQTLQEEVATLRATVNLLIQGLKEHQHVSVTRGESSCGCCPAPKVEEETEQTRYIPEGLEVL